MENQFVGCWKGALCGLLQHEDDCAQVDRTAAKIIAKFSKLRFNEPFLKVSNYDSVDQNGCGVSQDAVTDM